MINKSFIEKYPFEIPGINYTKLDYYDDNYEHEEDEDQYPENWMSL